MDEGKGLVRDLVETVRDSPGKILNVGVFPKVCHGRLQAGGKQFLASAQGLLHHRGAGVRRQVLFGRLGEPGKGVKNVKRVLAPTGGHDGRNHMGGMAGITSAFDKGPRHGGLPY